jgi:hydroxypyruvate reductase
MPPEPPLQSSPSSSLARLRADSRAIFAAGVAAVDPLVAVQRAVARRGDALKVDGTAYDLRHFTHVYVVGAGKGSAVMAQGLEAILGDRLSAGAVTVKYEHAAPVNRVTLYEAAHPIPDAAGVQGANAAMELVRQAGADDLVFCLLSGGGSALWPAPSAGISLAEKQRMTGLLIDCGARIDEINVIRKHLSAIKGGQLARLTAPARLITLVLSDVVGDRLDAIASGPTVPDPTTFRDCLNILTHYDLLDRVPDRIQAHFQKGLTGAVAETPKAGDAMFELGQTVVVANNRLALHAAREAAEARGYTTLLLASTLEGEARHIARMHAAIAQEICQSGQPIAPPACVVSGGETTVTVRGDGKGGRSQEFALAAALHVAGLHNTVVLSGGTDGTDGPTDAAGALVDGRTLARAEALGLRPEAFLHRNDAYHFFRALDDLLLTGPTGTNVMDMYVMLVGA